MSGHWRDSKRRMRAAPLVAGTLLAGAAVATTTGIIASQQPPPQEAEARIAASAVSIASQAGGRALLELELADGTEHTIALEAGSVRVDGRRVGTYETGGTLETAWREFLRLQAGREPAAVGAALLEWSPPDLTGAEASAAATLRQGIERLLGVPEPEPLAAEEVTGPDGTGIAIAPGGISFEALARELQRLRGALEGLGEAAEGADERLSLIVHDDFDVPEGRVVEGGLALLGGDLGLSGTVRGDVLVLDGTLRLRPPARVEGDILQVGGVVEQEGGRVAGEILSLRLLERAVTPEAPATARPRAPSHARRPARAERRPERGFLGRTARNIGRAIQGLVGTGSAYIGLALLGLIAVYFARPQLERVADTTRRSFGRSFALGFAGQILFFPAVLILVVLVITWLVLPFFLLGVLLAAFGGYLAAAHAAGELFAQRRYRFEWLERLRRSNSYYYVLSGIALLLLPFALVAVLWLFGGLAGGLRTLLHFVAIVGTWVVTTAGFGAVLLTRGGTREFIRGDEWMRSSAGAEAPGGGGA